MSTTASATAAAPATVPSSYSAEKYPSIRFCDAGRDIKLAYETFGPASSTEPPLLLVSGLSCQMLIYSTEMCEHLHALTGLQVVRFDNRDVGFSTHLDQVRVSVLAALAARDFSSAPYRLADMADDAAALIRHLATENKLAGPPRAHAVGCSMGGMIVQELCLRHPALLASATSIMSTCDPSLGRPTSAEVAAIFQRPVPPPEQEAVVAAGLQVYKVIGGTDSYPGDVPRLRAMFAEGFDRRFDPHGEGRQLMAIWSSPPRTAGLKAMPASLPFLIVHGELDPLVTLEGGKATAEAVGAGTGPNRPDIVVIPQMWHSCPKDLWEQIFQPVAKHIKLTNENSSSGTQAKL